MLIQCLPIGSIFDLVRSLSTPLKKLSPTLEVPPEVCSNKNPPSRSQWIIPETTQRVEENTRKLTNKKATQ